jgi:hypothetical protein
MNSLYSNPRRAQVIVGCNIIYDGFLDEAFPFFFERQLHAHLEVTEETVMLLCGNKLVASDLPDGRRNRITQSELNKS